jgi:hypothetical protein
MSSQKPKFRSITIDAARALRAGNLIVDFNLVRLEPRWGVFLMEIGGGFVGLRPPEPIAGVYTFASADTAIEALIAVGFDARRFGQWRPDPVHMERLHEDTRALLRQSIDMLGKMRPGTEPD